MSLLGEALSSIFASTESSIVMNIGSGLRLTYSGFISSDESSARS